MKTHQLIMVIMMSCLLVMTSACGKKSMKGVSGGEDHLSSEGNHAVTAHDKDLDGDPSVQLEESSLADSSDAWTVEALSASVLNDENGGTGVAGEGQAGASSIFPALTSSGVSGSSNTSFGASAPDETARRNGAQFSKALRDVFFAYDSWRLSERSHRILESNAKWLKAHPHARITIEGHCDERGTQAYNYVLGERRAETAKQYLSHLGVPSYQMVVVSYGKDRPVCHVFSAACFRSNRRAHFSIDMNTASRD